MKKARLLTLAIPIACAGLAAGLLVDYVVGARRSRAHLSQSWQALSAAAASVSEADRARLLERTRERGWWCMAHDVPAPANSYMGVIKLGNDRIVTFAFMCHHCLDDHDSITVFDAGGSQIRTVGGFCCEVQFSDQEAQSADLDALVALLKRYCQEVTVATK
jgi:hypothetical protein